MPIKKIICGILIFIFFLGFNCFKPPKWRSDITIPLYAKLFSIRDFIDTSYFRINNDSSLQFYKAGKLDTFCLLDSIEIRDRLDSTYTRLPDFTFSNLASGNVVLKIPQIVPGLVLPDTTVHISVPAFTRIYDTLLETDNIRSVFVRSAVLRISLWNFSHLPFDSVSCSISNISLINLLGPDSMAGVEFSHRIENAKIDSMFDVQIKFASSGTGTNLIPVSKYDSVRFYVKFDSVKIDSGSFRSLQPRTVRVTKQKIYTLPMNYQITISDLIFHDGDLSVTLHNGFPVACSVRVIVPELSFGDTLFVEDFDSTHIAIDLANRLYQNFSLDSTPLTLRTIIEFELGPQFVNFVSDNFVKVSCLTSNLKVDSLAGRIKDTLKHYFPAETIKIKLPDILSNVNVANAYASLMLINGVWFPIYLTLNMCALNNNGDSLVLDTTFYLERGTPQQPDIETPLINFTRFVNFHPDNVIFRLNIASFGHGWMSRHSFNTATYEVASPMRLFLQSDTVVFGPETLKIDKDTREQIRKNTYGGTFNGLISNHFPAGMSGELLLKNSFSDSVRIKIAVPQGLTNNAGIVMAPVDTNITLALSESETKIFADSLIKVSLYLYIPQTDTITVMGNDYFQVKNSYAKIRLGLPPD
ncbi:MAG: hypothetical protein N2201_01670 [candidate division WOR-3 bacterium]|nr:hypothetical protein [candidate division WOR-3 bacterium]